MKPLLIIAGLLAAAAVSSNAQIIVWLPEAPILGTSDVLTDGSYFDALQGFGAYARPDITVNSVVFHSHHDTFTDGAITFSGPSLGDGFAGTAATADTDYNTVLTGNAYVYQSPVAVGTIQIGTPTFALTVGHEYQVQIWETDNQTTFYGPTIADFSTIDPGYYAVGTFVATGTTADISFVQGTPDNQSNVSTVTALSVRDLGEIPEPSTYAMMLGGLALLGLGYNMRRKLA